MLKVLGVWWGEGGAVSGSGSLVGRGEGGFKGSGRLVHVVGSEFHCDSRVGKVGGREPGLGAVR